jgi:hypothetical protein
MRCFTHHDREAVGICCVCGKGLCPDCAVDLGHAICCRGACEQQARAGQAPFKMRDMHEQLMRNRDILSQQSQALLRISRRALLLTPILFIVIGGVLALFSFIGRNPLYWIPAFTGILFVVIGLVLLVFQLSLYKTGKRDRP